MIVLLCSLAMAAPISPEEAVTAALRALRAGVSWVNTPLTRELRAPFGGYKNSGVGRDGGAWSRALFTEEKTVTIPVRDFPILRMGSSGDA